MSPAAAALATPVLRNASGEPPLGIGGLAFRDDQGEIIEHDIASYRNGLTKLGVLQLEDGDWLAYPFRCDSELFATREAALSAGCDALVSKALKYRDNKDGEGTKWTESYANAIIDWATSVKPSQPSEILDVLANPDLQISDPIIRALHEANRARKAYPAGHSFAMTNPVINGEQKTVGTCSCGHVFEYRWGSYEKMDAAIEAHWQSFDHLPDKLDGRGNPISGEEGAERAQTGHHGPVKKRTRRSAPKAGDTRELANAPLPEAASATSSVVDAASPDPVVAALRAIDAAQEIDGEMARHLVGEGLAHATTKSMVLTDEGRALLAQSSDGRADEAMAREPAASVDVVEALRDDKATAAEEQAGVGSERPSPSETEVADVPPKQPRTEPAPQAPPAVAGSPVLEELAPIGAASLYGPHERVPLVRRGIAANELINWEMMEARLDGVDAPIGAASENLVPDGGNMGLGLPPALATSVTAGETAVGLTPQVEHGTPQGRGVTAGETATDFDDLAIDWPSYDSFIEDKIVTAPLRGIEVARDDLHPWLKPHCKDLTLWALRLGCAAIFASFGLHKTAMQLEWCRQLVKYTGQPSLCVVPLGVRIGFIKEGLQLGMDVRFIRTTAEMDDLYCEGVRHFLTNYESIREGKLDPNEFGACSLDEASVLRSYGSKTFQEFLPLFAKVPFKLVATATPSPNRYKELIHYSGFLGVMDTGLALTRFFQRNSEKAGDLTLYPHKVDEFWMWMHSWAAFLQRPSDLGYSDDGYEMPPADVRYHELPADHSQAEPERDGQEVLFRKGASSLQENAKARRDSLPARIAKMTAIIEASPDDTFLIWHDLEAEREAIEQALPEVVAITGTGMDLDTREEKLHEFEEGRIKYFATKPILSGSGSNFQYHCHRAIYVGMPGDGYKFNDFIQSLYRLQRFGQQHPVEIDIIYSEDMRAGRAALQEKWALDTEMRIRMSDIIKRHGLNTLPMRDALLRAIGVKRVEVKGENFTAINNDAVAECAAWPDNSVDLMVSSIPFGKQYEYSPSYRDFGHSDDNAHFWAQMDFLTSEQLRMLKPGRLFCCHVKDRIAFGAVTGQGVPTVEPFHAEAIMHYRAHGFQYLGMITVVTDVVRENNQTYRLGWSENAKDGTKMGCGMPEYILLLRKPQSDRTRSYADVPVEKSKDDYTRARWQVDAHGFWRSSGNRHLTPEEFAMCSSADLARMFAKTTVERVYDFEAHVTIGEAIERTGTLPATFMAIAPGSHHEDVWHDINRMRTLNMMQQRKGQEQHLCPLQFDIVDRLIERYSNPGELVFDPFGGLMTVPYRAILKGRKGAAVELSATYFLDGVKYLQAAEEQMATPQLFDLAAFDSANTPPADMMEASEA